MKKSKLSKLDRLDRFDMFISLAKQRSVQILFILGFLYLVLVTVEIPFVFRTRLNTLSQEPLTRVPRLASEVEFQYKEAPSRPLNWVSKNAPTPTQFHHQKQLKLQSTILSRLSFDAESFDPTAKDGSLELHKSAKVAWEVGRKLWEELESGEVKIGSINKPKKPKNESELCRPSVSLSESEFLAHGKVMVLPCGLTLGSHITVVGKPRAAHAETNPRIALLKSGEDSVMVSQFMMELQGLKTVDGEDPPRILHFNPRLKGDWSRKPVIEQNTCYRMQWGTAMRCEGWKSKADDETVDGQVKCEKWIRDDNDRSVESNATWWLKRLIGRTKKVTVDWPFPFTEGKLFVLTLSAGLEGYHVSVDGRHITSFPYRTGYTLEDATGLMLNGDVDVHSIFAASLPTSHPSFAPQRHLEMSNRWKAPPLSEQPVDLFIGVLSAGNHFAERMAVRKSWMQHKLVKSSHVVARFFVAMHARKEVNVELKREAEFFGDVVIVPYMDNYDLVVLKTVAICEYGGRVAAAKYIMKCDDDTFVRVDAVINEAKKVHPDRSFYIGNINYYHRPLRAGKWAVTYEEWAEEVYPPYANGPGYIMSSDIAHFIVSEFEKHNLSLFKMEDVSMGMWVEKFNSSKAVDYIHSLKFCQFGCIEGYYTAHYQSPRQMMCMWDKLQKQTRPQCCNMR
ncbi:hypothetical protein ERO13_A03G075800v2 [Gossypium hirsutum]|uniref:Hydroxyproline O-galactosyltransferase GALT6 n=4 Tax=Gossypium TaxID=3633 RepID=A0A1U8HLN2_GOSHI|nr:hydroxyproline O-galactosyltransferase GALT6-like [Gossypium hirsutum]KAB2089840.1 hypothetical protein ES319_A03G088600v1 [Gossypium barbadense]KAG4207592.1 hypothetical protein ERO13_A03G075800v2 [Gossypium hirsutum]TYH24505.1 hypothetical protein ES288_A03G097500v1 [Gossypium darwinii]TYI35751.1 hypothetical protein ES332_A03G098000v1 [Gossypium tomentosum]